VSFPARVRAGDELPARAALTVVPAPRRLPSPRVVLGAIYVLAFAYHWLQSRAHVTPAVFGDELFYSKLAQSLAAGDGLVFRGHAVFFPAPLAVVVQAPLWLVHSTPFAYGLVKGLNTALMAAAVFPAYALARRLVRPSYALLAAAMAVAGPQMVYGPYLMSEALAYPLFLLAFATMVRALERPSRRMEAAVVAVTLAAVLTRIQFLVVPLAYLVAVPVAARLCSRPLRAALLRHRLSLAGLAAMIALPIATGGAVLGTYSGARLLHYDLGAILSWSGFTAALLPFTLGWLVVPGALLGLAVSGWKPRGAGEAGFAALAACTTALVLLEVGAVAAGEANRALERYAIYLLPLAVVAFFVYAERGAPWRRVYAGLALGGACTAWLLPFPAKVGTSFTVDSPTFSVYGQLAAWLGQADAATIFAGVPLLSGIVLALLPLRRRGAPLAVGLASLALLLGSGAVAYAGDHAMTRGALAARAGDPPDWLDRSRSGSADYLELPGGSPHYGWLLEAWNRSFRRALRLNGVPKDDYASATASIAPDGRLLVGGRPLGSGLLVVNDLATAITLDGEVVARPAAGLTAWRVPSVPRVRTLAQGVYADGWASGVVVVRAWPSRSPGAYRVTLVLPEGHDARAVTLAVPGGRKRTVWLRPGTRETVVLPAAGRPAAPLRIRTDHADYVDVGTVNARLVAVRIERLNWVPDGYRCPFKKACQVADSQFEGL
jgi:hypothetical protein